MENKYRVIHIGMNKHEKIENTKNTKDKWKEQVWQTV